MIDKEMRIMSFILFNLKNENYATNTTTTHPSVIPQVESGDGSVRRPYPTFCEVERLFAIDPRFKKTLSKTGLTKCKGYGKNTCRK